MRVGLVAAVWALGCLAAACSSGSNACSPSNCTGCCSFSDASARGVCVGLDLQSPSACGSDGGACAACAQGFTCSVGACVPIAVFDAGADAGFNPFCVPDGGQPDGGCNSAADCPCGQSCELGTGLCTTTCFVGQPCNVGCCSGNVCVAGTQASLCGATGSLCVACDADAGQVCEPVAAGGGCGCASTADCPVGTACDTATRTCTALCGGPGQLCCAPGACNAGTFCAGGGCAFCGGPCEPCCPDGTCSATAQVACAGGTCATCGALGEPCCPGNQCALPACCLGQMCVATGTACPGVDAGTCGGADSCGACGAVGQPCCVTTAGTYCSAPGAFCDAGACQLCGEAGEACCAASAGNACDETGPQVCSPSPGAPGASCSNLCGQRGGPCCPGSFCEPNSTGVRLCFFPADGGIPTCQ